MRARAGAAALVLALAALAAGCGGGSPRHDDVASYIERVNAIQLKMRAPLIEVSKANQAFAKQKGKDTAAVQERLARSRRTLTTLRRRLAAVTPPADAVKLHRLLLDLTDGELALAGEVEQLGRFVPGFNAALTPAGAAGRTLTKALTGKGTVAEKATALERYGRTLGTVLQELAALEPPPASRPVYEAQVATLRRVRSSVDALARALREKRSADLPALLRRFDVAATSNRTVAAQKAQIAAVKAYNARVRALDKIAIAIARERNRLQAKLG